MNLGSGADFRIDDKQSPARVLTVRLDQYVAGALLQFSLATRNLTLRGEPQYLRGPIRGWSRFGAALAQRELEPALCGRHRLHGVEEGAPGLTAVLWTCFGPPAAQ
jgi:hypothetical protein